MGWKSGQTTFVPLRDRMEGAWLWTLLLLRASSAYNSHPETNDDIHSRLRYLKKMPVEPT
jgi:hypothetical protein